MKAFLLYGPLLWLRKVILYLLVLLVVLGFTLYFVANSPMLIRKAAEHFAPDYNITYSQIYGNALTGVEIDDLAYNNEPLAAYVALRWNPNGLLNKKIIVSKLEIEKINADTIKTLVDAFSTDENKSSDVNSSGSFDFEVDVKQANLSMAPLVEQGISISNFQIDIKDMLYSNEEINIHHISLKADSNVTDIIVRAGLKDRTVKVNELSVQKLDLLALQTLIPKDENKSIEADNTQLTQEAVNGTAPENKMIPKWVMIDRIEISFLPLYQEPVDIRSLEIQGSEALFDVEKLILQKAKVDLNTTTNLSNIYYATSVKNNKLIGKIDFKPKEKLFDYYELPIRHEAIGDITLDLNVSEKHVSADLNITMMQILQAQKDDFNFDIDSLHSYLLYDIQKAEMKVTSDMMITTPYAKDVYISNIFVMDKNISYSGEIQAEEILGVDEKFLRPLEHLKVFYSGDLKSVDVTIDAENLKGTFISQDFKTADLNLATKESLLLRDFIELPTELNQTKADLNIYAPLSFEKNATLAAYVNLHSNVITLDANVSYKDNIHIKSISFIPKDSLLRPYSDELKWDSINPVKSEIALKNDTLDLYIDAGLLKSITKYDIGTKEMNGTVDLNGLDTVFSGNIEEDLVLDTKITSIPSLLTSIESIYTLGAKPDVKGSLDITLSISQLKNADISLRSPQIVYHANQDTAHVVDDISIDASLSDAEFVLKQYQLTYADQKLFSSKPSNIMFDEGNISIAPVWLNDELVINGYYDTNSSNAEINATAKKLHLSHEIVEVDLGTDINTVVDGNKTSVKGKVIILGGNIFYDLGQKSYASDSDILIVQEMEEDEASPFMDNLSVDVQIKSKKPLVYKKGPIDIKAKADLGIYKVEKGELMFLGSVELLKGGSYLFEGKRFVLDKSYIHFTGDPNKPLIEAVVNYKSLNHLITITVSGSPETLNINFSSVPSLSREQILSIILFDSQEGAGTNSGEDMMKMMGGAMAKSALADIGVELDHLVLGSGNSVEVGKKLTDEMTIIYVNDVVAGVKLKYEHNHRLESVISADEESQAYDIIYKRDF